MVTSYIHTIDEQSFQEAVVNRSHDVPILVDFWAAWCNPCRVLSPILEGLVAEGEGTWELAKVDSDANPRLSQHYKIKGIPHCILFKDGVPVDHFVGVQSKPMIQQFLQKWVRPKENTALTALIALINAGQTTEAREGLEAMRAARPADSAVRMALATLALAEWNATEALAHIDEVPPSPATAPAIAALSAHARFMQQLPTLPPSLDELAARVQAEPDSIEARWQFGSAAVLAEERHRAAEQFLWILERHRSWRQGAARNALLDLFALWGDDAPETATYRQKMSWLLFA
jgi:putative thioredoxin